MPSVQNVLGQNTDTWKLYSQATRLMMRDNGIYLPDCYNLIILAQSVEPLTAEREVAGLIPGAEPIVTQGLTVLCSLLLPLERMFLIKF